MVDNAISGNQNKRKTSSITHVLIDVSFEMLGDIRDIREKRMKSELHAFLWKRS